LAVWLVADFEALSYQVTTTFDTSCAARIPTAPAINYTACYKLAVLVIRQSVFNFCCTVFVSVRWSGTGLKALLAFLD